MQSNLAITVRTDDVLRVFSSDHWRDPAVLRSVLAEPKAKQIGFFSTPELASLLVDATEAYAGPAKAVWRAAVALKRTTLITFDVIAGGSKPSWSLSGTPAKLAVTGVPFSNGTSDQVLLNVLQDGGPRPKNISAVDLAGVQIGEFAILFYVDVRAGRSAVFFDAREGDNLKVLIAGLAPGIWEIWRNGWLEETKNLVLPQAHALYYEGKSGGYFLRRAQ